MNHSRLSLFLAAHGWRRSLAIPLAAGAGLLPLLLLGLVLTPKVASANGVVTSCNNAGLTSALAGGGLVTFNCGPSPVTITVSSQKVITQPTTIDGGTLGQVILSGGGITRVFSVNSGASLTLLNLVVRDGHDQSGGGGGAVFVDHARIALTNTLFVSNTSTCCGGALYVTNGSQAIVSGSTFAGNQALVSGHGGAIYNRASMLIVDSTLHDNRAGNSAAIENYGPLTLTRVSLYSNFSRDWAGALYTEGPASLVDVAIYSNTVLGPNGWAGGMDDESSGTLTLDRVQIYANHVISGSPNYAGGGLTVFYGVLTLTNSLVYNNVADLGPGGGIHVSFGATLTVISSAIYGNRALAGPGGGLDLRASGGIPALTLINTTVSGNSATVGGGLSTDNLEYATLSYTTFYSNHAAAANNVTGTVHIANSIIAGSGNGNCLGFATSYGDNLEDGNSCHFITGDLTDTNPLLAPLAFNGGPTPTHALLVGSPAIDTASVPLCPATDQRGVARPVDGDGVGGARCDIGAFEYQRFFPRLWLSLIRR